MSGLRAAVEAVAGALPGGIAAFDADGTLWREDVGEAFLAHLVGLGWVALPGGGDPVAAYEAAVARDRETGYVLAAQLLAGLPQAKVAAEAGKFARSWVPPRLLACTAELVLACQHAGLRVCIVSASPLPIVAAAGPLAGFPSEACFGIETRVDADGRFTSEPVRPVSFAAGKPLVAARRGAPLAVACGDSLAGDLPLLEAARAAFVVASGGESALAAEARRRGWPVLSYEIPATSAPRR